MTLIAQKVASRYLRGASEVREHFREIPEMLDASRLLKPRTLGAIEPKAVFYYRRSRAWELQTTSEGAAQKVLLKAHGDLIPKAKLTASDPYLHQLELYVSYPGGFVQATGAAEKKRDTDKLDLKHQIMHKGKEIFTAAGISLSGSEGAYVLRLRPVRKEFRGKFPAAEVTAPTLEELSSHLDRAIAKVETFL